MLEIRKYNETDLDSVNVVLKEAFSIEKSNFSGDEFIEIVASNNGDICGYLLLTRVLNPIKNKYYMLVDYVCVSSKYRGLGIGKKLINYAYDVAKKEKVMYLQLTCSTFRVAAHRLYESCGFVKRDSDIYRKEIV